MNPQTPKEKRVLYILLGTLVILFILLVTLLSRKQKLDKELLTQNPPTTNTSESQMPPTMPLPRPVFSDYSLETDLPTLPTSVKLSDVKKSFTSGEALSYANKLGFPQAIAEEGVDLVIVTDQPDNPTAILTFNRKTGNWLFSAETGYPAGGGTDPTGAAQAFLNRMGVLDSTIVAHATYKRESNPGVTYVEFHRTWEGLGLPYLNPVGALNLDETERLSDIKLGYVENTAPDDPDITWSSDAYTGKIRPNNFNTITIAVNEEGNTISFASSNMKLFAQTQSKPSAGTLKTPEEALEDFKNGKASFSLVKPLGEGTVDVQTIFPDSQAVADNAVITDFLLTYLDDVAQKSQDTLYPHYIIKGTTTVKSGYQVAFVQTIPAVKQINTLGVFAQNSQVSVFPGQGSTLQYGTFNWLTPAPANTVACAGLTQLFALPNGAYIGWYPNTPPRTWYYVPAPGEILDQAAFLEIKKVVRWEVAKACRESKVDPAVCAAPADVAFETACTYLGTGSPFLHVSTTSPKSMKVSLPKAVTYVNPGYTGDHEWSFTTTVAGSLALPNGTSREKLYYEYDKSVFKPYQASLKNSSAGYLVNKTGLEEFVNKVSVKLGLTDGEKADLLVELSREAGKFTAKTLKVGLVDRTVVDKVLPVTFKPQPQNYHRVFFYVTAAEGKDYQSPALDTLERDGDTVVEVGAVSF